MKFIHFADYHLGVENAGKLDNKTSMPARVLDYLDILDSMIEFGEQEGVDLYLFAGDAYHRSNPSPTYMVEFSKRIMRMAQSCPVILTVGNHDSPGAIDKSSAIDVYDTLSLPNVIIGKDYEIIELELDGEKVEVATFPYPFRSKVLNYKSNNPMDNAVKRFCHTTIASLANQMSKDTTRLFVGHFTVDNCIFSSERLYVAGDDSHVDLNYLLDFDYVALGHIHLHQVLNDNPPVIYSGSMERVDFGEENDEKGFVYAEAHGHNVTWEFVRLDSRPYKTLDYNFLDDTPKRPTAVIVDNIAEYDLQGYIIRIIIHIPAERAESIRLEAITEALEAAGVFQIRGISIQRDVLVRKVVADMEEAIGKPLLELEPIELLSAFFDQKGVDKSSKKKLLKVAQEIMEEVNYG